MKNHPLPYDKVSPYELWHSMWLSLYERSHAAIVNLDVEEADACKIVYDALLESHLEMARNN